MTTPALKLLDNRALALDNSTFALMAACPTMAAYHVLWKRTRAGTAIARDSGKSIHTALEHRYKKLLGAPVTEIVESEMIALFEAEFAKLEVPDDTHLTMARLKEVLREYNKAYVREPFDVLAVEMPMAATLGTVRTQGKLLPPELTIIWQGRLDLLTRWSDGVFTTDHKTTAKWDSAKIAQFEVDDGQKGYAWLVQELARVHPELGLPHEVRGFCVNGIVIRPDLKRETSRVTLPRTSFERSRFYWTPEVLDEWRDNTLLVIETWLRHYENGAFPRHRRNCANYFGKKCGFWDVCQAKASQREMVLGMDLFKDVTWDPLERNE